MGKYIYLYPFLEIIEYDLQNNNCNLKKFVLQSYEQMVNNRSYGNIRYEINEVAVNIILNFNGTKTYEQIVSNLEGKYNGSYKTISNNVITLLNQLTNNFGFKLKEQEEPNLHKINLIKYKNLYPTVYSIELTNRCNIRCRHCYGNFSNNNLAEIPKEKLLPLFSSMRAAGGLVAELTGGDPSVYPYTADAIEIAFDVGFQSLMLLTNGIYLNNRLVDTIVRHKKNIFVQIDLHSLNDEYYDWFTQSKDALAKVKSNIDRLINKGVQVRVCSIFTPKNFHELLSITEWAHKHGAKLYAPSVAVELGRAKNENIDRVQ